MWLSVGLGIPCDKIGAGRGSRRYGFMSARFSPLALMMEAIAVALRGPFPGRWVAVAGVLRALGC